MKRILIINLLLLIMALWSCHDPYMSGVDPISDPDGYDNGEPTVLEGVWNSVGMSSSCVLETPFLSSDDIFSKKELTFSGNTYKFVDTRYNGCTGYAFYYYTYKGTFALKGSDASTGYNYIDLKVDTITLTMTSDGLDVYYGQFYTNNYWDYDLSTWESDGTQDITGRMPESSMPELAVPAHNDVMLGEWEFSGSNLVLGFDKTPYDGYTSRADMAVEYKKQ